MENRDQKPQDDITQQRYKGANPIVAGLGESVVHGKSLLIGGAILGAVAGAIFPTRVGRAMEACHTYVSKLHESPNHLVHGLGGFGKWSLNIGEGLVNWVRGFQPVKTGLAKLEQRDPAQRVANAINSAVVTSAALSTIGLVTGFFTGARVSGRGKQQFEQAKEEITSLRTKNAQLSDKLIETQFALEDTKTAEAAKHGTLTISHDDQPKKKAAGPAPTIATNQASLHDPINAGTQVSLTN